MDVHRRQLSGFTLVELLVVIAIIGVLIGLLLPAVQSAREASRRAACLSKVKQLALANLNFENQSKHFPPGSQENVFPKNAASRDPASGPFIVGTSWIVFVLPLLEEQSLYDRYDFNVRHDHANNASVGNTVVNTLFCPSGPAPLEYRDPNGGGVNGNPSTHYYGVMGPGGATDNFQISIGGRTFTYRLGGGSANGAFSGHGILTQMKDQAGSITTGRLVKMSQITDGTSKTFLLGERSVRLPSGTSNSYRSWIRGQAAGCGATKNLRYPLNSTNFNGTSNFNDISFGSQHPGGALFGMADGSARFVNERIALDILRAVASIGSGEVAQLE